MLKIWRGRDRLNGPTIVLSRTILRIRSTASQLTRKPCWHTRRDAGGVAPLARKGRPRLHSRNRRALVGRPSSRPRAAEEARDHIRQESTSCHRRTFGSLEWTWTSRDALDTYRTSSRVSARTRDLTRKPTGKCGVLLKTRQDLYASIAVDAAPDAQVSRDPIGRVRSANRAQYRRDGDYSGHGLIATRRQVGRSVSKDGSKGSKRKPSASSGEVSRIPGGVPDPRGESRGCACGVPSSASEHRVKGRCFDGRASGARVLVADTTVPPYRALIAGASPVSVRRGPSPG